MFGGSKFVSNVRALFTRSLAMDDVNSLSKTLANPQGLTAAINNIKQDKGESYYNQMQTRVSVSTARLEKKAEKGILSSDQLQTLNQLKGIRSVLMEYTSALAKTSASPLLSATQEMNALLIEAGAKGIHRGADLVISSFQELTDQHSAWAQGNGALRSVATGLTSLVKTQYSAQAEALLKTPIPLGDGQSIEFSQWGSSAAPGSAIRELFESHGLSEVKAAVVLALNTVLSKAKALAEQTQLPQGEGESTQESRPIYAAVSRLGLTGIQQDSAKTEDAPTVPPRTTSLPKSLSSAADEKRSPRLSAGASVDAALILDDAPRSKLKLPNDSLALPDIDYPEPETPTSLQRANDPLDKSGSTEKLASSKRPVFSPKADDSKDIEKAKSAVMSELKNRFQPKE